MMHILILFVWLNIKINIQTIIHSRHLSQGKMKMEYWVSDDFICRMKI